MISDTKKYVKRYRDYLVRWILLFIINTLENGTKYVFIHEIFSQTHLFYETIFFFRRKEIHSENKMNSISFNNSQDFFLQKKHSFLKFKTISIILCIFFRNAILYHCYLYSYIFTKKKITTNPSKFFKMKSTKFSKWNIFVFLSVNIKYLFQNSQQANSMIVSVKKE